MMKGFFRLITILLVAGVQLTHAYRDQETGTFLTRDPIGYQDGPNVYCYVHCNPITQFDPLGLSGTLTIYSNERKNVRAGLDTGKHSWVSWTDDDTGETVTFSIYGNYSGKQKQFGLNKNTELGDKGTVSRSAHLDDNGEAAFKEFIKEKHEETKEFNEKIRNGEVTDPRTMPEKTMLDKMAKVNYYEENPDIPWTIDYNCAPFSAEAWEAGTGEHLPTENYENTGPYQPKVTPKVLGSAMREANERDENEASSSSATQATEPTTDTEE